MSNFYKLDNQQIEILRGPITIESLHLALSLVAIRERACQKEMVVDGILSIYPGSTFSTKVWDLPDGRFERLGVFARWRENPLHSEITRVALDGDDLADLITIVGFNPADAPSTFVTEDGPRPIPPKATQTIIIQGVH